MNHKLLLLWFFTLLSHLLGARSSIHEYKNGVFEENGNAYLFYGGSEGMRESVPKENSYGVDNGRSYIGFDSIKFTRTQESASRHTEYESSNGLVQVIIFEAADRDKIGGSAYGGQIAICCTPDLAKVEGCKQGQVIIRPSSSGDSMWPFQIPVHFYGDSTETIMESEKVNITKSGMYNLYFIFCDPQLKGLVIDGATRWKNPSGYLPGRMAPLETFYGLMSLAYLILGIAWISQYVRYWQDILALQNYLTAIIALGMFEVILWYFEYANFNATGKRPMGITFWAVTFGVFRKTLSRILILVVSMGYGVVRPTLGGLTSKVVLLGATYFLAAEFLDVFEHVGTVSDLSGKARLFLVLPVAILDAFFVVWIFTSLSKTVEKLQARRMAAKLELYRKFMNALALSVIMSVAWIGYELYFKATDPFGEQWQRAWIISAFWNVLSFALLCVICTLWAPSQNSTRYAYSEDGESFDDEDALPLKSSTNVEPEKAILKPEKKEKKVVDTDVFSLDDEAEEDKRE
ncbi:hypothetical protein KP509_33G001000 [Ceratopteris richardii]|uniref:GOST seven transmembrane domain-containing protein n=2 Tax=Ceratopteris richardii TaxID=49495 RepID=A0A8T2QMQ1_CERRI|nr:hypothetical protein KP509_33G001000 [Ceratopteris richardii]